MLEVNKGFQSSIEECDLQAGEVIGLLQKLARPLKRSFVYQLEFVIRELFNNAVEHGNQMNRQLMVIYRLTVNNMIFELEVMDEGQGLDLAPYNCSLNVNSMELLRVRQRGLSTIHKMGFELFTNGTSVGARKKLTKDEFEE